MKSLYAVNVANFLVDGSVSVYKYGYIQGGFHCFSIILSTPFSTSSTVIKSIHFRSVGHFLLKHGLQSTSFFITIWLFPIGPVFSGSVEPNIATIGILRAAAMCIGPESFVTNILHCFIRDMSSLIDVFPAMLMTGTLERFTISAAMFISC